MPHVHTQACRNGDLRISGLQLPEDSSTGAGHDLHRSLAILQTSTFRWSLAEDLAGYARAGIGGIGLYRPKLEETDEESVIDAVRRSGLAVTSISWIGGFTGSDGRNQEEALFDAGEAIRLAAALEAGTVAVVSGGAGSHITKHARRLFAEGLKHASDFAAGAGVRLSLHPFSSAAARRNTVLTTLEQTVELIADVGRDNVGILFDAEEFGEEPDLIERIPSFASMVHVVRLSDRRTCGDRRWAASGRVAFVGAMVKAFTDAGYDGPYEFDFWSETSTPSEYEERLAGCQASFNLLGLAREDAV